MKKNELPTLNPDDMNKITAVMVQASRGFIWELFGQEQGKLYTDIAEFSKRMVEEMLVKAILAVREMDTADIMAGKYPRQVILMSDKEKKG